MLKLEWICQSVPECEGGGGSSLDCHKRSQSDLEAEDASLSHIQHVTLTPSRRPTFEFSARQVVDLRKKGISAELMMKMEALETALFRSPHGPLTDPKSYFSEKELQTLRSDLHKDDNWGCFLRALGIVKREHPKKIALSNVDPNILHTPPVRFACDEGGMENKRIFLGVSSSLNVRHFTADLLVEEEAPETDRERAKRKATQESAFRKLEQERGVSTRDSQLIMEDSQKKWHNFFKYMEIRTQEIDATKTGKITANEIEDVFKRYLESDYQKVTIDGCDLCYNPDEIDLARSDILGRKNVQLMKRGLSPIGVDGKPMNVHHLTRRHPGTLVLMTETFHGENSKLLHIRNTQYMRQPGPVDRNEFSQWRGNAMECLVGLLAPEVDIPKKLNFDE